MIWSSPSSILQFASEPFRPLDVFLLRGLVATAQHHAQGLAVLHQIDPIPGPVVNAQFWDALTNGRDISGIAECGSVDPCEDFRFGTGIVEPLEPASELVGLTNFSHICSVAYTLPAGKASGDAK
jgi:hypothetical protein